MVLAISSMADLYLPIKITDTTITNGTRWCHLGQAIILKLPMVTTGHKIPLLYKIISTKVIVVRMLP